MGKLLAEAWRWAQSFYSPFQSSSSQKVLLLARPFSRRGVSKGTGTLHRLPDGKALRTVQQRSTRKYECCIRFLDEVTGTPESQRPSPSELYQVVFRELLATARQPAKQAPRMPVSMLEAIETLVTNTDAPPYLRVCGWWVKQQNSRAPWRGPRRLARTKISSPDQWLFLLPRD